jgi:hypothetical protein
VPHFQDPTRPTDSYSPWRPKPPGGPTAGVDPRP